MTLSFLYNIKIRTKLLLALVFLALMVGVVGHAGSTNTSRISQEFSTIIDTNNARLVALLQLKNANATIKNNISEYNEVRGSATSEDSQAAQVKYDLLAALENLQSSQAEYNLYAESANPSLNKSLNRQTNEVVRIASDIASAREQTKVNTILLASLQNNLQIAIQKLDNTADQTVYIELHTLNKQDAQADRLIHNLTRQNLVIQVIALALALLISYALNRLIVQPLKTLRQGVQQISMGNLKKKITINSRDELGQLAKAFNTMSEKLDASHKALEAEKAGIEQQVVARTSELAKEQARFVASINNLDIGYMMTDNVDHVIYSNPKLWEILDIAKDTPPEKFIEKLEITLDLQKHLKECREKMKKIDLREVQYDKKVLSLFLSPVISTKQSEILGVVMLVNNITEEKVMQRSKDEFFSIASHELRTPLTAIRGNASMIQSYYQKQLKDEDLSQMVGDIHESSTRLIEIVNDFLDASRLEQGKVEFKNEPMDIMTIIESVAYEMTAVMTERSLYLHTEKTTKSLPYVLADKDRVKQILYNLTGNALKFTDKGGITIKTEIVGKKMKITVIDTGRGIPADKQALLFHKFQQAGNSLYTRDTTRGTGLGLYISKLLCEDMGGKLNLENSEVGKGTTFSFTLPLAPK